MPHSPPICTLPCNAQTRCIAEVSAPPAAAKSKPSFDFKQYMADRARIIDEALDKSVPLQYPEVINESMRYSLLAGASFLPSAGGGERVCPPTWGGGRAGWWGGHALEALAVVCRQHAELEAAAASGNAPPAPGCSRSVAPAKPPECAPPET